MKTTITEIDRFKTKVCLIETHATRNEFLFLQLIERCKFLPPLLTSVKINNNYYQFNMDPKDQMRSATYILKIYIKVPL